MGDEMTAEKSREKSLGNIYSLSLRGDIYYILIRFLLSLRTTHIFVYSTGVDADFISTNTHRVQHER